MTNARGAARADRTAEPAAPTVRSALVGERHSSYQLGNASRLSLGSTERFRVSVVLGLGLIGLVLGLSLTD